MIKNNTPYKGKLKFKFEEYPHYTDGSVLNKVHLDLGFTKLVSRISMNIIDPEKIKLINKYTGGRIASYKLKDYPSDTIDGGILQNSFVTLNGDYIGDIRVGWWYYLNNMRVNTTYPINVAEIWDGNKIKAFYGYSHRGGASFKIGDRLFKEDYQPIAEDYEPWQWAGWEQEYEQALVKAKKEDDDWWYKDLQRDGIAGFIPFTMRGPKEIEVLEEALQAADNLGRYLG